MKRAVFLYNPNSGRGNIARNVEAICACFARHGWQVTPRVIDFQQNPWEGNDEVDMLVVAGGDGSVNYALNTMKQKGLDIPIGIIPAGTANDFARAIGMDSDPLKAAEQLATGEVDRVDCGRVNDLYFINIFSFGIFTTTSQRTPDERKHRMRKLAYIIEGVKEFRTMHAVPLEVVADGERFDIDSLIVLILNGETAGGFPLARRSSIKDGVLNCLFVEKKNLLRSTLAMGQYLLGGNPKIVHQFQARRLEIRSTINEPTDVDGQRGADFPLTVECIQGGVQIMCPQM